MFAALPAIVEVSTAAAEAYGAEVVSATAFRAMATARARVAASGMFRYMQRLVPRYRNVRRYIPNRYQAVKGVVTTGISTAVIGGGAAASRRLTGGGMEIENDDAVVLSTPNRGVSNNSNAIVPYTPSVARISPAVIKKSRLTPRVRTFDVRLHSLKRKKWPRKDRRRRLTAKRSVRR